MAKKYRTLNLFCKDEIFAEILESSNFNELVIFLLYISNFYSAAPLIYYQIMVYRYNVRSRP